MFIKDSRTHKICMKTGYIIIMQMYFSYPSFETLNQMIKNHRKKSNKFRKIRENRKSLKLSLLKYDHIRSNNNKLKVLIQQSS